MEFQRREKQRLAAYAQEHWQVGGHVLPRELAQETLHEQVRASALQYYERHKIKWWTSRSESGAQPLPTGHLNSSQIACVNHLEPARVDGAIARRVVANVDPALVPVALDDGFVEYEWIGKQRYLDERGARARGANVTSLDAVMCGDQGDTRILLAIEWKYLESYGMASVATSRRGTDRVSTYRALLERSDCPIQVGDIRWLFYEPYYQLMRQTLLAWQMVEHREFGASEWLHIHVIPEGNVALRNAVAAAPGLVGESMAAKWRSVLKEPARYRLVTPNQLVDDLAGSERWGAWRRWLRERYMT